jgi:hypothetical protein
MSDEKEFSIEPPDPDNQLPAPEEPAGQLESPPPGEAQVFEMPPAEPASDEPFNEPLPPSEEPRMTEDYIVTPPPAAVPAEKKSNRTIWIIVIVALLVLCCCCLAIIGLVIAGLVPWNVQMQDWYLVPNLSQFI